MLEPETGPPFQISARARLRWKRVVALEQDLAAAMELAPAELCYEVGFPGICFSLLHLVPLGGNDPVIAAMYEPLKTPTVATALATDRVVIAACGRRADLDTANPPLVFKHIDMTLAEVSPDTEGLDDQIDELYRRFHGRIATDAEKSRVRSLAEPLMQENGTGLPVSARELAKTACYAIATTTEFLFH